MDIERIQIDGRTINITNPDKLLWPEAGITKRDYVVYLSSVAHLVTPYTRDRLLMMWRYPDGVGTRRIEEKAVPKSAPDWIQSARYKDRDWIVLNDAATLCWVANYAAIELHVPFTTSHRMDCPTEIVFDLDPSPTNTFAEVLELTMYLKEVLDNLALSGVAKTSGQTGMQVYVPVDPKYPFEQLRRVTRFVGEYMRQKHPDLITLERAVNKRAGKLYFDYLQLWKMRTMPAPYSARAQPLATVSAPVSWREVDEARFQPNDFTIRTMGRRINEVGDLFDAWRSTRNPAVDDILAFLDNHQGPGV